MKKFNLLSSALRVTLVLFTFVFSAHCFADEVSLVKGLYKSQTVKNSYDTSSLYFGGRYLLSPPEGIDIALFFQGDLGLINYSGTNAPSDDTSIRLLVGGRKIFNSIATGVIPYAALSGGYANIQAVNGTTQNKLTGLVYMGDVGLQILAKDGFFIELETNLFTSHLFTTNKIMVNGTEVEETNKRELAFSTEGAFTSTSVALGLKF